DVKTTHGTGCSFSAAIAAELAKKTDIPKAVEKAKKVVTLGMKFGLNIGKGYGPVNPMAYLYRKSSKYNVLMSLEKAKTLLETTREVAILVPEVGMNIAMAVSYAESVDDVAAIEGRIVKTTKGARAAGNPKFGCSSHLARYILEIIKCDEGKMAAINMKFSDDILETLENWGLTISFYDRRREPEKVKRVDGMTVPWGVNAAIKKVGKVPDVIYHRGDVGKEPIIVIFGLEAYDLAKLAVKLAREIGEK
ncbi:bifunctional hydroxymethylpyrimidine kinase/phosphomethylpyrimidine kinase, partial [Candidatus Bathyarchaeota archaeon]|nr:bifunctional hydroxymethylpyrimidine kinase/phosphomethylpyrimidine kinase [Candidatus Bathyarchaeota archaeon]